MSSVPNIFQTPASRSPMLPSLEVLAPVAALVLVAAITASGAGEMLVWYTIRGTGIIAYLLLTTAVAAGLLMTNRVLPAGQPRVDLFEVHTFSSLLALLFSSVHGLALLLDTYIGFSPSQLLIPFTSDYRPLAVGLGIISLYLSAGIYGSFWAKRFIGHKAWRALHFGAFLGFLLATLHGFFSGADSGSTWMLAVYAVSTLLVLALTARRISTAKQARTARAAG